MLALLPNKICFLWIGKQFKDATIYVCEIQRLSTQWVCQNKHIGIKLISPIWTCLFDFSNKRFIAFTDFTNRFDFVAWNAIKNDDKN